MKSLVVGSGQAATAVAMSGIAGGHSVRMLMRDNDSAEQLTAKRQAWPSPALRRVQPPLVPPETKRLSFAGLKDPNAATVQMTGGNQELPDVVFVCVPPDAMEETLAQPSLKPLWDHGVPLGLMSRGFTESGKLPCEVAQSVLQEDYPSVAVSGPIDAKSWLVSSNLAIASKTGTMPSQTSLVLGEGGSLGDGGRHALDRFFSRESRVWLTQPNERGTGEELLHLVDACGTVLAFGAGMVHSHHSSDHNAVQGYAMHAGLAVESLVRDISQNPDFVLPPVLQACISSRIFDLSSSEALHGRRLAQDMTFGTKQANHAQLRSTVLGVFNRIQACATKDHPLFRALAETLEGIHRPQVFAANVGAPGNYEWLDAAPPTTPLYEGIQKMHRAVRDGHGLEEAAEEVSQILGSQNVFRYGDPKKKE